MPRLRPLPKKEDEEPEVITFSAPPEGDIEIELSEDDGGPTEIETVPEKVEPAPKPEVTDDNPLQKALQAQQRAEELQRTAQRERDEAVHQTRQRDEELSRERGERQDAEYNSVLTAIAAEQSSAEKAESDYAAFAAAGDWANAAKAQRVLAAAAARLDRLEDGKQAFESKRKTEPETRPAPQPQGFEQRIAALPENAKGWLRKHPEFINDTEKNRKIQAAHGAIVDLDGVEAFSPAYFDALDTRFGFKQAPETNQRHEPEKPKQRSIPMTAPVSRDVPNASGVRTTSTKITLSEEERDIARRSIIDRPDLPKMTDAQKEYAYAKNKQRLMAMKANGTYSERRE